MADNIAVTPGSGATIGADDIGGGVLAQRVKPVWGPDGTGNDVDVASGKPLPVQIRNSAGTEGVGYTSSATFTTGTTAYAASDCVGASGANAAVDFGVLGRSGNNIMITSVELEIDSATIISGETSYNVYFYNVTPPSAINDSSPFTLGSGDRASFLGKVTLPNVVVEGVTTATLYCRLDGINQHMLLSGTHLFGYLVTVGAFTPTARVYKITVHTIDL